MPNTSAKFRLFAFDIIYILFSLTMILCIVVFGRPLNEYLDELTFYSIMLLVIIGVSRFIYADRSKKEEAFRFLYPFLLFSLFYVETDGTILLIFDSFQDTGLVAFEKSLFGVNPTLYIDRNYLNVWLNELFSLTYFSYYFMIPLFLLILYLKGRIDIMKSSLTAITLCFSVSFLLFFLYPIEGPRWHFAGEYLNNVDGFIFRDIVTWIIANGAIRGGCMPSTHFAIAFIIMMYCLRYYRKVGWALVPVNIGLAIGTFWGRFHYVSDIFIGAIIGLGATLLVWKYYDRSVARLYSNGSKIKEDLLNVS